jgi:hypothetical protein
MTGLVLVYLLAVAVIVILSAAVFDKRYRGRQDGTDIPPGFRRTDEVFRDPETGEWMAVYYNESTGERIYRKML